MSASINVRAAFERAEPPADVSARLFDRARHVMPSGYTRNMIVTMPHPHYAESAAGCWIVDADGTRRIDWVNNFASLIHGHGRAEIVKTIASQADRLMSATMPAQWEVLLAELLVDRVPSVERVRFTNSGTEANMVAIKAARAFTGRSKVAKLEGGYHGQYDLLEASFQPGPSEWGDKARPNVVPHNAGTPKSLLEELVLLPLNDVESARERLRAQGGEIAAVILDPYGLSLGSGVEADRDFIAMLREETSRLGIVLIFDEVWSLRLGWHGAQGELGITPDLTTMGKIIGGGLPIGALGGRADIMAVFEIEQGEPKVKHSGTFTANPMSTAAGYVAMSLLTRESFASLATRTEQLRTGIDRVFRDAGVPGRASSRGSVATLSLTNSVARNYREYHALWTTELRAKTATFQKYLADEGLHVLRNVFVGSTAIGDAEIKATIAGVAGALARLQSHP